MACDVSPVAIFKSNDYAEDLPIFCQPENWREEWGEDSTAERRGNFHRCYRYKWHLKLLQVQVTPQIATGDNSNCNGCRHLKLLLCAQCYVQLNQSCWIKSFDLFSDTLTPNSEGAAKKLLPVGIILSVRLEIWQELFTVRYATNCTYYKCNFFYCIKTIANMDQSNIFQWAGQQIKI